MQEKTEDTGRSFKAFREGFHDWGIRHLWRTRILEYSLLSLLVTLVVAIFFKIFDLFQTDADSARYMLSAMVQAQAAIVAIVVTLTLVAVQLTASAYSPRVTKVFRDNPDMWILLLSYGISISYGLLVLKMIQDGDLKQISLFGTPIEYHICVAYVAVNFTFFMLFLYMWNVVNLLNPETIINWLTTEITAEKLINSKEDPIQPIMDIVHGSIMKYDIATTRVGLEKMTDRVIEIIDTEINPDDDHEAEVKTLNDRFCTPVAFAGKLAVNREDEKSAIEVIETLQKFGESIAKKKFKKLKGAAGHAAGSLVSIGNAAEKKGLEEAVKQVVQSLTELSVVSEEAFETVNREFESHVEELEEEWRRANVQKKFKQFLEEYKKSHTEQQK